MISKIQLSDNTTFRATYQPCTHHNGSPEIRERFSQQTADYPDYKLVQDSHSYGGNDFFRLYQGNKLVSLDSFPLTSMSFKSIDDSVARIVEIFNTLKDNPNVDVDQSSEGSN